MLTDSHLHLSFAHDKNALLQSILGHKVKGVFVSVDAASIQSLLELAPLYKIAFFAGFHPLLLHNIQVIDKKDYIVHFLDKIFSEHSCIDTGHDFYDLCGVGEIGLDKRAKLSIKEQCLLCYAQMVLAYKYNKAVSLHVVKAHDLMLSMLDDLKQHNMLPSFCVHGSSLSLDLLKAYSKYNAYFSFGKNLIKEYVHHGGKSFAVHSKTHAMLLHTDKSKILIESDYDKDASLYPFDFIVNVHKSMAEALDLDSDDIQKLALNNLKSFISCS